MTRILFVCMGNICRSPMAEGVLRRLVTEGDLAIEVDSAGTHSYHTGETPDERAVAAAARRGCDIAMLKARTVDTDDFETFDLIVAMDRDNLSLLRQRVPTPAHDSKLHLFLDFADQPDDDVPDPYYGGVSAFEHALDLIERAATGLLEHLQRQRIRY
ncbi:MAG: low molecular weight phosphotyrosine protein phosphatase [Gammaproteobacteria bacterium]|nr:low molecular weight phosphotyrosine protein phosphatase [Gammaproteobacteria bacterium]NND61445.1 low molecular weight phosphotyrosine protein phosphatase [Gammaproteobacteria bacterium]